MLNKITALPLLFISTNVFAGMGVSASIDSLSLLVILGLGLPALALYLDKKNKK